VTKVKTSICSAFADQPLFRASGRHASSVLLDHRDLRLDFDVCFMGFHSPIVKKPVFLVQETALIL
jgi:hypothetical protein